MTDHDQVRECKVNYSRTAAEVTTLTPTDQALKRPAAVRIGLTKVENRLSIDQTLSCEPRALEVPFDLVSCLHLNQTTIMLVCEQHRNERCSYGCSIYVLSCVASMIVV